VSCSWVKGWDREYVHQAMKPEVNQAKILQGLKKIFYKVLL